MQKGQIFIFLLISILLLIVAGGVFFLERQTTPKPSTAPLISQTLQPAPVDKTSNWKQFTTDPYYPFYTNNERRSEIERMKSLGGNSNDASFQQIRISVLLPPGWVQGFIDEKNPYDGNGGGFTFSKGGYQIHIQTGGSGGNLCTFSDRLDIQSVPEQERIIEFGYYKDFTSVQSFVNLRRVKISIPTTAPTYKPGVALYMFCSRERGANGNTSADIWGSPGSDIGAIGYTVPENASDAELTTMDKIISTIKLLDQNSVDTSNWKTYIDNEIGIQFQYPNSLEINKGTKDDLFIGSYSVGRYVSPNLPGVSSLDRIDIQVQLKDSKFLMDERKVLFSLEIGESGDISPINSKQFGKGWVFKRLSDVRVDGIQAKSFISNGLWQAPVGSFDRRVYIQKENNIYMIRGYLVGGDISENTFNNLVKTFKFL